MSMPPLPPPPPELLEWNGDGQATKIVEPINRIALLWRDHTFQFLILLGLIANSGLFGYLALRFDTLPDPLPFHFDSSGLADRIEAKGGIFGLPLIGLCVLALNLVLGVLSHRRERAATLLLTTCALLVQILMWFAVSSIIGGLI
jgi:uncharacterized membrane protein